MSKNIDSGDVYELWDRLDSVIDTDEYSAAELRDIHDAVSQIAEDAANGYDIYDTYGFWDFLDLTGLDAENFPWDDFREWYDSL